MRIVAFADTHGRFPTVPPGDVVICAGDFTNFGDKKAILEFYEWFGNLPHNHKLLVYGNHEITTDKRKIKTSPFMTFKDDTGNWVDKVPPSAVTPGPPEDRITLLHGGAVVEIDGVTFWGHPGIPPPEPGDTPCYYNAHQLETHDESEALWKTCPKVDVLVTHAPPYGILDISRGKHLGNEEMRIAVEDWIKPRYHIFGHIHESAGFREVGNRRTYFNVAGRCYVMDIEGKK